MVLVYAYKSMSPLPDPHASGERGLVQLVERVKLYRSYHELGKTSLSCVINYGVAALQRKKAAKVAALQRKVQ